ncbi:type IV pilus modification PilV family protein [Domibacillus mangrovi]|uniref:Prepilin-type N-terminal cleavage/methylation domain-containing protein n=1 Tax=Domibacillus mangrovi TaxID=1714354 RepID=A0A1Q5P7L1_9BACI|nr:prepilin-type N-terminal cleavage/methylation domain-containing protein [Domibacillus mangrovi]OKL38255.1 hypothetical protein BLL40_02195 [Domibacillus mangrovi]
MLKKRVKNLMSNDGMTLIEILLSIVILTIVVLSFSAMFIQSARTNQQTESAMDATYVAQTCIEEVIHKSIENSMVCPVTKAVTPAEGYDQTYRGTIDTFYVNINKSNHDGKVVVKVFRSEEEAEDPEQTPQAQMETIIR